MASTSKFELSSGSPDGPYPSGQRGSYPASMDRLGSFREAMDNRPLAPPGMIRSGSTLSHSEVMNFLQSLPCEGKTVAADHKLPRELKRVLMSALGISPSDSLSGTLNGKPLAMPSLEELRRVKATLNENSTKASDRSKTWDDAISKIEKYQNVVSKKRLRSDVSSSERSNSSLLGDRSIPVGTVSKMVSQSHMSSSGFELGPQKSEDKSKNAMPNKRVRTSMADIWMDGRVNCLSRPSGPMERDRDMLKLVNGGAVQSEEKGRSLTTGVEGWEKSKTRKKRSGIKSDVSASAVLSRPSDGDRVPKRLIQQRIGVDARSRLNNAHGFRSGSSNGTVGVGKLDITSQQNSPGMRATTKGDQDDSTLPGDRRDRPVIPVISDKERVTLKAVNKPITQDDNNAASPTSIVKASASVRAPRSSSGAFPKPSPHVHRTIGTPDDWEHPQSANKLNAIVGANNRKRSTSMRSSSPQWVGQRPQKISRVARRTNLVPVVSSLDEAPTTETVGSLTSADNGLGFPRRVPSNTHHVKLKGDNLFLTGQSESEESEVAENKSRDKDKKSIEGDEKVASIGSPALPRKNKAAADEDVGDIVRRQGRTGRGFTPARTLALDKSDNAAAAKQLRSARFGSDKIESKAGRLPTKKMSDRKQHACPRQINGASEFAGVSEDDREELLAAANAVLDASHACSSPFWKQIEPVFGFVSVEDIAFLKQQIHLVKESAANILISCDPDLNSKGDLGPLSPSFVGRDDGATISNSHGSNESEGDTRSASNGNHAQTLVDKSESRSGDHHVIPLSLRIVASGIEDMEEVYCDTYDPFGVRGELEDGLKPHILNPRSLEKIPNVGRVVSNGYRVTSTGRYIDELEFGESGCDYVATDSSVEVVSNFGLAQNGLQPEEAVISGMICTELDYQQMSFDDRILVELQSIGVSPEPLVEDDINEEIRRLEEKLHGQIMEKKSMLIKLEEAVVGAKEVQERNLGRLALDKLIGIAYRKNMSCRGPNASHGKSTSNKITKRIVLAFVKRALARYQKFEETGKSCFSEPAFRNMFHSLSSNTNHTECMNLTTDGEAANTYSDMPARTSGIRTSAHMGSVSSCLSSQPEKNSGDADDKYHSVVSQSSNHLPEQTFAKGDQWPNRGKQRELLLHDVGSVAGTSLRTTSGFRSSLVSGTKGKRSERDRDGKGHNRELSRNTTAKVGRPSLSNAKVERKSKAKPKQRTTQLSASVNSLIGKTSEQSKVTVPPVAKSREMAFDGNTKEKYESRLESNDPEALDLSHLPLTGVNDLGVPDDLDGQAQDFGTWLNNFDVEGLQDDDFMGLDIPMDDLSNLNMMV